MQTLKVDARRTKIPSYKTAAEAIAAEEQTPRAKRAATDSLLIGGLGLVDSALTRQSARLGLSNGHFLEIELRKGWIDWHVSTSSRVAETEDTEKEYGPFNLVWGSGPGSVWDPLAMLKARHSFAISAVFAGQIFFSVYFNGGGALQFLPLWSCSDDSLMLYFEELEPMSSGEKRDEKK